MAPDDRDRNLDNALARHLRSSASSGVDAGTPAAVPAPPRRELCPDPEILAAYHDGLLSPDEGNLWKRHVVGCDRCQLVLAHLETPVDIPLDQESDEHTLAAAGRASSGETRTRAAKPVAAPRRPPSARWLWLVPAGALAASLVAWVSLREPKPVKVVGSSPVEVAENRQPPSVAPSPKPFAAVSSEHKSEAQPAAPPSGDLAGVAPATHDLASKEPPSRVQLSQQAPLQYAGKPAHGPSLSAQKQEQQQTMRVAPGSAGLLDQKKLDAQISPRPIGRTSGAAAQQAPAPAPPPPAVPVPSSEPGFIADGSIGATQKDKAQPAPGQAPASTLPAANSRTADSGDLNAPAASASSLQISAAPATAAKLRPMMRAAALQNPHVFFAPDGKHAWRLGPAGSLDHSTDKGVTWTPEVSGVYTDLLAGSAPSSKVSWIVGDFGTILRTTDSGAHWTKLDSPVANNLAGIRATDAMRASIWFVPDAQNGLVKTYQTTDGGLTWTSLPDQ